MIGGFRNSFVDGECAKNMHTSVETIQKIDNFRFLVENRGKSL